MEEILKMREKFVKLMLTMLAVIMLMIGTSISLIDNNAVVGAETQILFISSAENTIVGIEDDTFSGTLVVPDEAPLAGGATTIVKTIGTQINSNTGKNYYANITGLDISNAVHLEKIVRNSFKYSENLAGKITFPASFVNLGKNVFTTTKVECFEFLGDVDENILLYEVDANTSEITYYFPSTLTRIIAPVTSKTYLEGLVFPSTVSVDYRQNVVVDGNPTALTKVTGDYFTEQEYALLAESFENLEGFKVNDIVYTAETITTLLYDGSALTSVIKTQSVPTTYTVQLSSGLGYNLSGPESVLEGESYVATLTLDEYYNESNFVLTVVDSSAQEVEYKSVKDGNVYSVTIENVTDSLEISVQGVVFNTFTINITPTTTNYTTLQQINLTANIVGHVPTATCLWEQQQGANLLFDANEQLLNLGTLSSGNYTFKATATIVYDGQTYSQTATQTFEVSDVYYNIQYVDDLNKSEFLGETKVLAGETYAFNVQINPYYTESDYTIKVYNADTNALIKTITKNQSFIVENVACNLKLTIVGLQLNNPTISLVATNAETEQSGNTFLIETNINLVSTSNIAMPMDECTITWKVNCDVVQNNNLTSLLLNKPSAGNYAVEVIWNFESENILRSATLEFSVDKVNCTVTLNQNSYTFNNVSLNYLLNVEYNNTVLEQDIQLVKYVFKNGEYISTDEIKNVGSYKLEVSYNSDIVEFSQNSKLSCTFEITPQQLPVYYKTQTSSFVYDNERHYVELNLGINSSQDEWTQLGLDLNEVKENLYVVNGDTKTLIYSLPVFADASEFVPYQQAFVNVGEYYCELVCNNTNFALQTSETKYSHATYEITPYIFTINANKTAVYKSTEEIPSKQYSLQFFDTYLKVTLWFNREAGDTVGEYAITGIHNIEIQNESATNFEFNLDPKSKIYKVTPKIVSVIWNKPLEFVYDGEYHCPTAKVQDDEVEITIEGAQYLPNQPKSKYVATAVCADQNYLLSNNAINFTINSTTISGSNNGTSASIESDEGFNPIYTLNIEESSENKTFEENLSNTYSNKISVLGSYSFTVVDEFNKQVEYSEKVNISIEKPAYFTGKTRVLEILADGTTKEVTFVTNGNSLTLQDVDMNSSFVFVTFSSHSVFITVVVSVLACGACAFVICWILKKRKKIN